MGSTYSSHRREESLQLVYSGLFDSTDIAFPASVSQIAAEFGAMMPELLENENVNRAQLILKGSPNEASSELIKLVLYQLSNNMVRLLDDEGGIIEASWDMMVKLLNVTGITSTPLRLGQNTDVTIAAIAEKLFQCSIKAMYMGFDSWEPIVNWLLSSGQSPNIPIEDLDVTGTPLGWAVNRRKFSLCKKLIDEGADPDLLFHGKTPLMDIVSSVFNNPESEIPYDIIELLLDAGASLHEGLRDTGPSVLMEAVRTGNLDLIDFFVRHGARVLHQATNGIWNQFIETCSVFESAAGLRSEGRAMACIQHLLGQAQSLYPSMSPADFISKDVALVAASKGYNEILALLYRTNPDVVIADDTGLSALGLAAYYGHFDTCKLLLSYGVLVDVTKTSRNSPSPLHLAAIRGYDAVVELLHQHGAELNIGFTVKNGDYLKKWFWMIKNSTNIHKSNYQWPGEWVINSIGAAFLGFHAKSVYRYLASHGARLPDWAIHYGASYPPDLQLVRSALAENVSPNLRGPDGRTPLQTALAVRCRGAEELPHRRAARVDVATELLNAGATLSGGEAQKAIFLERWELVEDILRRDSQNDLRGHSPMSMLEAALLTKSDEMVERVLAWAPYAYDPGALCPGVVFAISEGKPTILERVLSHRKPSAIPLPLEGLAVGIAAWYGKIEILEILIGKLRTPTMAIAPVRWFYGIGNAAPDKIVWLDEIFIGPERYGVPFWHDTDLDVVEVSPLALAYRSKTCLIRLLEEGYHPDRFTIALAVKHGDSEILRRLMLLPRLDVNQAFTMGPLYCSVKWGHTSIAQALLEAGEDVDEPNDWFGGRNPLQKATEDGNLAIIDLLLKAGADVNAPAARKYGATALQLAAIKGRLGIARKLIELGAKIDTPRAEEGGRTALEGAAEHGRIDTIQFLLDQGAQTEGKGQTQYFRAIKFAEREGHLVAAKMLKRHREWTAADRRPWDWFKELSDWEDWSEEDLYDGMSFDTEDEEELLEDTSTNASEEEVPAEQPRPQPEIILDMYQNASDSQDWPVDLESFERMTRDQLGFWDNTV